MPIATIASVTEFAEYLFDLAGTGVKGEFFTDNLLAQIHFIIEMIWFTSLAPWGVEFPFSGSLISTLLQIGISVQGWGLG